MNSLIGTFSIAVDHRIRQCLSDCDFDIQLISLPGVNLVNERLDESHQLVYQW
jgi:hypothetical protein